MQGQFQAKLPQLMDLASYEVVSMEPVADDQTEVKVNVVTTTGASGSYCFLMKVWICGNLLCCHDATSRFHATGEGHREEKGFLDDQAFDAMLEIVYNTCKTEQHINSTLK